MSFQQELFPFKPSPAHSGVLSCLGSQMHMGQMHKNSDLYKINECGN